MSRFTSRGRGYTLVEVLVLVTILGIAGAAVIPSLGQTHVLRVQAAVRSIVADITYAQSDALAFQSGRAIVFDADLNSYSLLEVTGLTLDPENDTLYDPQGPGQQYIVSMDDNRFGGAKIQNVDFDGTNELIFDEIGGPVVAPGSDVLSSGGSLEVAGPDTLWRINVAAFSGKVTVEQLDAP
jgi:type II secretory pathway pseudopilin PulG